jgi:hypothetical protein
MRTTSSIAALHLGHDMRGFVLDSDIPLRRLKLRIQHKGNDAERLGFGEPVGIFLWCSRFEKRGVH